MWTSIDSQVLLLEALKHQFILEPLALTKTQFMLVYKFLTALVCHILSLASRGKYFVPDFSIFHWYAKHFKCLTHNSLFHNPISLDISPYHPTVIGSQDLQIISTYTETAKDRCSGKSFIILKLLPKIPKSVISSYES